jgi:hypothetical protein
MARALIVGCGCRGRELGKRLLAAGWQVRGTSRTRAGADDIAAAGLEAAIADPDRVMSILDHVGDVTLVFWLLGSAQGERAVLDGIHGSQLERLLSELVDSPVRGFVYERAGRVPSADFERGAEIVRGAGERWRIPVELVDENPGEWKAWTEAMLGAAGRLTAARA